MKTEQDIYENSKKTNELRYEVEKQYGAVLTKKGGDRLNGIYKVRLTHPAQMTNRLLNRFCANGTIHLYPNSENEYEDLAAFRADDGAINLSAMYLTKPKPEEISEQSWTIYQGALKELFKVLRADCITPTQRIVADIQRSFGYGAPKISKKFGGDVDPQNSPEGDVVALMAGIINVVKEKWSDR